MRATTQLDIAKAAGVSQRAVASVVGKGSTNPINGSRVSEETRKLILDVAARLNYQPHRQAQLMRGVKSGVIGVLKRVGVAQYHVEKDFFATKAIVEADYSVMASDHLDDHALERNVAMLIDAKVEGVMLVGFNNEVSFKPLQRLKKLNIPTVALPGGGLSIFPSVVTDHRKGMRDMVLHLAEQGMKRLVYGCPTFKDRQSLFIETLQQRLEGFRDGAAEAGIAKYCKVVEADPLGNRNREAPFDVGGGFDHFFGGGLLAEELLKEKKLPEALVCCNDSWAIGAMGTLTKAGVKLPEDMALTGFDGEMIGSYSTPTLTTVCQPGREIAYRGVHMLLKLIHGEKLSADEQVVRIPGVFVVRQSSQRQKKEVVC